jgi:hypothetical protein
MSENTPDSTKQDRQAAKVTPISGSSEEVESGEHHMERLATTFESSARRWEMIVYPSLFAFIVLAIYGFFLVYNLTHDVASLARNVSVLTQSIDRMVINMDEITGNMGEMNAKMSELTPIRSHIEAMNESTRSMAMSADGMRYQMGAMNYNIGRPMSQMSSFMPW